MFYVVDAAGRIVGAISYRPDEQDLRGRGERTIESDANIPLDEAIVAGHPDQPRVARRNAATEPRITLAVSAEDEDGDGVPELVADARSRADIVATVFDADGRPLQAPLELTFRTTAGSLSRRTVATEDGRATVELRSSRETVTATISVSARGLPAVSSQIEFVPLEPK